jgi:hypothetical protein
MESSTDRLRPAPDDQSRTGQVEPRCQHAEKAPLAAYAAVRMRQTSERGAWTAPTSYESSESAAVMPKSTRGPGQSDSGTQPPAVKITPAMDSSGPVTTIHTTR